VVSSSFSCVHAPAARCFASFESLRPNLRDVRYTLRTSDEEEEDDPEAGDGEKVDKDRLEHEMSPPQPERSPVAAASANAVSPTSAATEVARAKPSRWRKGLFLAFADAGGEETNAVMIVCLFFLFFRGSEKK